MFALFLSVLGLAWGQGSAAIKIHSLEWRDEASNKCRAFEPRERRLLVVAYKAHSMQINIQALATMRGALRVERDRYTFFALNPMNLRYDIASLVLVLEENERALEEEINRITPLTTALNNAMVDTGERFNRHNRLPRMSAGKCQQGIFVIEGDVWRSIELLEEVTVSVNQAALELGRSVSREEVMMIVVPPKGI